MYFTANTKGTPSALNQLAPWAPVFMMPGDGLTRPVIDMKIKNSLKALKARHRDCQLVRRKGRVYIINKSAPRYKARQG